MIFCTVGSEKFPFNRLVEAVDELGNTVRDEVFIQIGNSTYEPKFCDWKRFINFSEVIDLINKAKIIISHAGVGTILLCLNSGKVPIIVPRQKSYKEHVDDHQLELSEKLEKLKKIIVLHNLKDLNSCVLNYTGMIKGFYHEGKRNIKELENYLINIIEKNGNV